MGLDLGPGPLATDLVAGGQSAPCLSPGGQLSARTAEMGSPNNGAQHSTEKAPHSSVAISMESCLLFLSVSLTQRFRKAIHLTLKILLY